MNKKENGPQRFTLSRKGKFPYSIEEKGQSFLIKQKENIVVIPTKDIKWLIGEFNAILSRKKEQKEISQKHHYQLYEPKSARQRRDNKQRSGEIE